MKAVLEKIEDNRADLSIEIEAEKVDNAIDLAYRKLVKEAHIPGFRKGKAPRRILERHLGKEPIFQEALDIILPDAYTKAIEDTKIEPIDRPEVQVEQFEEGSPLKLKINVEVKPEVKLGDYKGIHVEKPVVEVAEEERDEYLEKLRERHARIVVVTEGAVEEGDTAVIDFKGYIDGQTFAGGIADNFPLEIGSKTLIEGFEDQLIGAEVGESKDVNVTFPEDYREEDLAGKDAVFKVDIKEIKRKELLPLDDEFAKDISDFDTLEELKEDIENMLKERKEKEAREKIRSEVIGKVVENAKVDVPDSLVDRRLDAHLRRLSDKLKEQNFSLEEYCNANNTTEEQIRKEYREQAEESVKTDLVLEEIAAEESIEITEDEILEEVQNLAERLDETQDNLQKTLQSKDNLEALSYGILMDKTVKFLIDNSSQKE